MSKDSAFSSGFFGAMGVIFALIFLFIVLPLLICTGALGALFTGATVATINEAAIQEMEREKAAERERAANIQERSRVVLEDKGSGSSTEAFQIKGHSPTFDYSFHAADPSLATYRVILHAGGQTKILLNDRGKNDAGTIPLDLDRGAFQVEIVASGCEWEYQVSEKYHTQ